MTNFIHLNHRQLINISGADRFAFLQGLISNDVNKTKVGEAIYSLMLNPQGRFLFEFFITANGENLILETGKETAETLIKKLSFYKLRSAVEIKKIEDLEVFFIDDVEAKVISKIQFIDPRKTNFGQRIYSSKSDLLSQNSDQNLSEKGLDFYHHLRLQNKIVDENDLTFDQSIAVEFGFDDLNAIDYQKGCYVGQEIVARTHYRGQIRKKIFLIEIENLTKIAKNSEITWQSKKQGIVLSSLFYQNKLQALALIRNVDPEDKEIDLKGLDLRIEGQKITIKS